jgi:hypothetical protein
MHAQSGTSPLLQPHAIRAPDSQIYICDHPERQSGAFHLATSVQNPSLYSQATKQYRAVTSHNMSNGRSSNFVLRENFLSLLTRRLCHWGTLSTASNLRTSIVAHKSRQQQQLLSCIWKADAHQGACCLLLTSASEWHVRRIALLLPRGR